MTVYVYWILIGTGTAFHNLIGGILLWLFIQDLEENNCNLWDTFGDLADFLIYFFKW